MEAEMNNGGTMNGIVRLTGRETEVLRLIARGCTYSQVADRLGMSAHTVASHIKNAYRKLEVHCAAAAVMRAVELQLLGEG
jgi:DNA-binding CsgD family transcriptional regulator